ncbi:MAG: hypothetical protein HKN88_05630 [Gammaproteobacteria bacterium]|nr:hypothetical protein [Gammaproteobacteria bacterium]NNC97535.1 hypothetical protein [Gammaproteobacteria bacterium]NNM14251.1 hypothetical protein [Gammaproteobacteria bacterium]
MQDACEQMVEQQVRAWEVLDPAVLDAMHNIPREEFLPEKFKRLAHSDASLAIRDDFLLPCPSVQGKILQALELEENDPVLLLGGGVGYLATCLAFLGGTVTVCDADEKLLDLIRNTAHRLGYKNLQVQQLDWGTALQAGTKKYAAISSQYAFSRIPESLQQALQINGRAVLFEGEAPLISCVVIERIGENEFLRRSLFETEMSVYPLKSAPEFSF